MPLRGVESCSTLLCTNAVLFTGLCHAVTCVCTACPAQHARHQNLMHLQAEHMAERARRNHHPDILGPWAVSLALNLLLMQQHMQISLEGQVLQMLMDSKGEHVATISSVLDLGDQLILGSLGGSYLAAVSPK